MGINRRALFQAAASSMAATCVSADTLPENGKKGIGLELRTNPDWINKLKILNADWFYTWGSEVPDTLPSGIEFIPMIWGRWSCTGSTIGKLRGAGYQMLLGFNEPDQYNQSNLSVEEALRLWPILMESGMRLGSPACVHADGEWMTAFMAGIKKKGYRVDFIALHAYMDINSDNFLDRMEKIQRLWNRPISITEFAAADWEACADRPNIYSQDAVCSFMEKVLPALEKLEYIERYAWYSSPYYYHPLNSSVLFRADGSLNKLGRLYASF